ncbi:MAG TPA: hypothetical protein VD908_10530 [Cytophagales bacterium]|nr:hypothetical protein [Cytophagales bacterium]
MKGNHFQLTNKKEVTRKIQAVESTLDQLKQELRTELERTNEVFEDYYVLRKGNGKISLHVSKLGKSDIIKQKIQEVAQSIKD